MAISKIRGTRTPLVTLVLVLGFLGVASRGDAVDCGNRISQNTQNHPRYSGTLPNLLTTGGEDTYIYGATTWGYVRASLANPSNPGPLSLIQIGLKTVLGGTNGGLIYMNCDCNQGASTMAVAQAPDGSARIASNWIAPSAGVLRAMVATTSGSGDPVFGSQIDVNAFSSSPGMAAVYMAGSNKYFGYFPGNNVQIVDLTSPSGSTSEFLALTPIGSFGWSGLLALKAGKVSVPGVGSKTLLAAYLVSSHTLRVAEVDNNGTPTEKASVTASGPNALAIANVSGKAYIFSADYSAGLNVYEYTGSSLIFRANLPGNFTNVVVKGSPGSPFPAIFVHRSSPTDSVDIYDTRWIVNGTSPVRAFSLPHQNSPAPTGRGDAIAAVVTSSGNQIVAHVYRLATTMNAQVNPEHLLVTDNIDISCIAADPTSKPLANAVFTNLTAAAQGRTGTNYYGDQVQLTDASSTGSAMLSAAWDINTNGLTYGQDTAVGTALSITGYFPCDPSNGSPGNFATGANCAASVGLGLAPATTSFRFGEKSSNPNGQSDDPFFSAPIQFLMPQISLAGFDGTTLRVLTNGTANASGTQGNTSASSFQWVFRNGQGAVLGSPTGSQPNVPVGATFFDLTVNWPGGYQQTLVNKALVQTDLVPSFTTSPTPAIKGGTLRITNTMQRAPGTTVQSVDLSITSGGCPGVPAFQSTLPASFFGTVPLPADVPVPATEGSYCVTLRYNYIPPGQQNVSSLSVSNPLTVVIPAANLVANVSGPSSGAAGTPLTFTVNATGGTGVFTYAWDCKYSSFSSNFQPGTASQSCTFTRGGVATPAVKVTDTAVPPHSTIAFANVTITGGAPPPPGTINVSVAGPASGSGGTPITYTANATGGTQPYSYAWACDYSVLAGGGQFTAGTQTKACTFTGNGVHAVAVRVTDSASNGAIGTASTNIGGPALPLATFSVTGGTLSGSTITVGAGQPVTFTATEANAASWGWSFGDTTGGTGRTITKTYATKGTYQGQLIVTGNGNQTNGTGISSFTVQVVTPLPSGAFTVSGANPNAAGTVFTASVGEEITMTASEPNAINWGWDFGDNTSGSARSVKKTYGTLGTYTVKLFVTGNDNQTTGLVISTFTVNVVSCVTSGTTLCLNDNRFKATVAWAVPDQGKSGAGTAVPLTGDTGYYWFFSPTNIELVVKVVDGRTFNGNFWVFYGALSNVEYTITIKDTSTGAIKTYHNPSGTTASLADVDAFPAPAAPASKTAQAASAITVVCTPSTVAIGQQFSCQASPAGTYSWNFGEDFPPRFTAGPNPNTHSYGHAGSLRVSASPNNGATVGSTTVVVTAGSGGVVAAIAGPSTGTAGTAMAFTGSATGGTGPYSFAWNCEYDAASPSFTAGTADNPCTYTTTGSRIVALRATDSSTPTPATAVATKTVTVEAPAGPGLPSVAFTLDGATLNSVTGKYETEIGRPVTFTATEVNAASWGWVFGDGTIGGGNQPESRVVTHSYAAGGNYAGQLLVQGDGTHTVNLNIGSIPIAVLPCAADGQTLCLNNGRFKVRVDWRSDSGSGAGTAVPVTADTGEFWFLSANNIELLIKVVDGSAFNGHFWVFYGALSNFEYTITVTDTTTGAVKTYHNPLGTTASLADIDAF